MEDLLLSIPVILATGVVVVAIFFFSQRANKTRAEKIRRVATEQGWQYEAIRERLTWGYRLKGEGWTLEAVTHSSESTAEGGSSPASHVTRWQANQPALPGRAVLIGARPPGIGLDSLGGLGETILQKMLQMALGAQTAAGMGEVEAGSSSLRQRFLVVASDVTDAQHLLAAGLEQALLNWKIKETPLVKLTSNGLEIEVRDARLEKPEDILVMVRMGKVILDSWRKVI